MTATGTAPAGGLVAEAPRSSRVRRLGLHRPSARTVIALAVALAAFGVRLSVLLGSGGLLGSAGYDDGVYYAASAAFVHGRWPYTDFLLLHPPVVVLAGAPFAALGAIAGDPVGVIAARLTWIAIGAAGCALVSLLAGSRSTASAIVAGAFAACFFPLAYGERSMLLEPLATVLLLLAVLLGRRSGSRAALVAGLLAGVAVDVKIWYVLPVLVIAAFSRRRGRFLLAAAASATFVAAPFLIRAPTEMVRQILLDQLGRPHGPDDSLLGRLSSITGARFTAGAHDLSGAATPVVTIAIALVVAACAVAAWRSAIGRQAVVLMVATVLVLLAGPTFFTHYVSYSGPWTAIVVGIGAGALVGRIRRRGPALAAVAALVAVTAVPTLARDLAPGRPAPFLTSVAAAAERVDGCVVSDDPGLLAALDVLSRDLDRGCVLWPDVTGHTLDGPGLPALAEDRASSPRWQALVSGYLLSGDAVIVDRVGTGLSAATEATIGALPVLAQDGDLTIRATRR